MRDPRAPKEPPLSAPPRGSSRCVPIAERTMPFLHRSSHGKLILLASVASVLAGCGKKEGQAQAARPPKPAVEVVVLHTQPASLTTELPGRTTAYRVAEVRPQVYGVILK